MRSWGLRCGVGLFGVVLCAVPSMAQTPKVYVAQYVEVPPIIDGIETTPDEWSTAADGGDQWKLLTVGSDDTTSNRFDVVWDDFGIYMRHQVNSNAWAVSGVDRYNPNYENLNLFLDPNTDGEPNENTDVFGTSIDGYWLSFNQPLGASEISPSAQTAGMFSEAHVDALFGNQGGPFSGFSGLQMMQNTSVDESSGYTELFVPWDNFDASDPSNLANTDTGLFHPEAPDEGEEWYFNVSRIETAGRIPAWESPAGAVFIADRPHGILQFGPRTGSTPCDVNGDGSCDGLDIDTLAVAVLEGSTEAKFDRDGNGTVDGDDRIYYVEEELNTWIGDSDLDGEFGTADLVAVFVAGGYEDAIAGNATWSTGDWSGDLDFTTADFVDALVRGGYEVGKRPPRAAVSAVPEPSTLVMMLLGLLGASRIRRSTETQ